MKDFSNDVLVVTGATGFVGWFFLKKIGNLKFREIRIIRSREHDLRDPKQAEEAFRGASMVVHIAGITGGIEFTRLNQGSVYYDNIMMNTNVLHCSMKNKVKKVVSVGSVCSYPKYAKVPFKEEEIWDGYPEEVNSHYGMAKKMLIVQGEAYRNQYGLNSQVLLFTNLYGPHDHFEKDRSHVVPALITKFYEAILNNEKTVILWGSGTPTRDLLYVEDAAEALYLSLLSDSVASPVNIGSGSEISILELAESIKRIMNGKFDIIWDKSKPDGQPRRLLDVTRAQRELGFTAKRSLSDGLSKTIEWYTSERANKVF